MSITTIFLGFFCVTCLWLIWRFFFRPLIEILVALASALFVVACTTYRVLRWAVRLGPKLRRRAAAGRDRKAGQAQRGHIDIPVPRSGLALVPRD